MTSPSEPDQNRSEREGVNLGKDTPAEEQPFDPYRFGKPEHPIPAEYAPPGYTGPTTPPPTPYGSDPSGPGNPYGRPTDNPFGHAPGTPYGPPVQQYPQQYPQPSQQPPGYGPPPSPPYGYGAPPPPYGQSRAGHGKAVAALVLGICSIVFCWLSFFDGIFVVLGLIFALIAMSESKTPGRGGRGMAVAGLVCTIVGAVLATLFTVWIVHAANQCGGFSNSNVPGWDQCIRDHL